MKPSTGPQPHEGECDTMTTTLDTMTTTLDPNEKLQLDLDNIRRTLDGSCDKAATLDLKNFNLSELTATLFSSDSDMDLTLEDNTLDFKRSNLDAVLGSKPATNTVNTLSGVQIVMSGSPVDERAQTYDINMMDMPDDIMDDLDAYLDEECPSPFSTLGRSSSLSRMDTLDHPSTLSLAGSSQYSTLDTSSSPHQRIVSDPLPSVDSLSHMVFSISDQITHDIDDSLDRRTKGAETSRSEPDPNLLVVDLNQTMPGPSQLEASPSQPVSDRNQSMRSITYVSSFSLDTMERGDVEEVEVVGDAMDDVIRSVAPASYEDCSLKLIQSPQTGANRSGVQPASYPTLHGDEVRTLTPEIDPLISDNLDTETRDKTLEVDGCMSPKEHHIREINLGIRLDSALCNGHAAEAGVRARACSVPNRSRSNSDLPGFIKRSFSESNNNNPTSPVYSNIKRSSSTSSHRNLNKPETGSIKRSASTSASNNRNLDSPGIGNGMIKRSSSASSNRNLKSAESSVITRCSSESKSRKIAPFGTSKIPKIKKSSSNRNSFVSSITGLIKRSSSTSNSRKNENQGSGLIKRSSSTSNSRKNENQGSGLIKRSSSTSNSRKNENQGMGLIKRSSSTSATSNRNSGSPGAGLIKRSSSTSSSRNLADPGPSNGSSSGHVHVRAESVPYRNRVCSETIALKRSSSESSSRNGASERKRPVSMFSVRSNGQTDSGFTSLASSISSSRPAKPSRGIKKGQRTENSTMSSSTGGTQCSGSGPSLEDVSCPASPSMSDSSETSPPRHSTSISSLPDLPHNMGRSRSAASNVSDHVLTTLDRPRTQSFAGTPIRQAWLQVCCYEKDTQTGNFLIDKHKVQIDGKFLHPELNNDHELYRISLTGLVNEERLPKTDKMLSEIGDGVIISRDRSTGDVTLTKLCRKDVFMMNDNFLALKEDEKCKGRHIKLEQNTTYTIFNKQKFVEDVRNSAIDLTKIHTIGQVAIAFIKINGNSVKGVPCWIKVQCLEAMNLLKSLLAGSTSEEREWLRKPSMDCPQSPQRANKARLSFGKSLSKNSLKDSKSSVNSSDSGNTPIPRTKSRSQLFRNKKKSQQSNGVSPEPRSNRNSGASQHLEPFTLNYGSLDATEEPPPSQALRDNELLRSRRISSPPNNLTSADVSLPLRRNSPSLPDT